MKAGNGAVFGLAVGLAFLVALFAGDAPTPPPRIVPDPIPPKPDKDLEDTVMQDPTLNELEKLDEEKALDKDIEQVIQNSEKDLFIGVTSPLNGVTDEQWRSFVISHKNGKVDSVTKGGAMGMFWFYPTKLRSLGIDVKAEDFLASVDMQYEALVQDMLKQQEYIFKAYPGAVGATIDGKKATLSGIMAVSRWAGIGNLGTWLTNADARKGKLKDATRQFNKSNGIF